MVCRCLKTAWSSRWNLTGDDLCSLSISVSVTCYSQCLFNVTTAGMCLVRDLRGTHEHVLESDSWSLRPWSMLLSLHFVVLHQMDHFFSPGILFHHDPALMEKLLIVLYLKSLIFVCHIITAVWLFVFGPPSPSCSAVCLDQAPAPPLHVFSKKQSWSDGEKAVALCCDFSFTYVFCFVVLCCLNIKSKSEMSLIKIM